MASDVRIAFAEYKVEWHDVGAASAHCAVPFCLSPWQGGPAAELVPTHPQPGKQEPLTAAPPKETKVVVLK